MLTYELPSAVNILTSNFSQVKVSTNSPQSDHDPCFALGSDPKLNLKLTHSEGNVT